MLIEVEKPEIQQFVREQLESGRFRRAEDVVESALAQMKVLIESRQFEER